METELVDPDVWRPMSYNVFRLKKYVGDPVDGEITIKEQVASIDCRFKEFNYGWVLGCHFKETVTIDAGEIHVLDADKFTIQNVAECLGLDPAEIELTPDFWICGRYEAYATIRRIDSVEDDGPSEGGWKRLKKVGDAYVGSVFYRENLEENPGEEKRVNTDYRGRSTKEEEEAYLMPYLRLARQASEEGTEVVMARHKKLWEALLCFASASMAIEAAIDAGWIPPYSMDDRVITTHRDQRMLLSEGDEKP